MKGHNMDREFRATLPNTPANLANEQAGRWYELPHTAKNRELGGIAYNRVPARGINLRVYREFNYKSKSFGASRVVYITKLGVRVKVSKTFTSQQQAMAYADNWYNKAGGDIQKLEDTK